MKRSWLIAGIITIALGSAALFLGYRHFFGRKRYTNTIQRTLAIIKPDAVRAKNTGKIIDRAEHEGFTVVDLKKVQLDREQVEQFYGEFRGKSWFNGMVDFMTSGPAVVMILEKINAIPDWRDLIGSTDPRRAKDGTLRRQFGTDIRHNAVQGSDNAENALREIKFFFADRFKV